MNGHMNITLAMIKHICEDNITFIYYTKKKKKHHFDMFAIIKVVKMFTVMVRWKIRQLGKMTMIKKKQRVSCLEFLRWPHGYI